MPEPNFYDSLFLDNKIILSKNDFPAINLDLNTNIRTLIFTLPLPEVALKALLENIMKTCKLEGKYEVISEIQPWHIFRDLEIKEVILFGISELDLGIDIQLPKNWPMKFDDKFWIKTDSLNELNKQKNLKNELWLNALKPYFLPA